MTLYCRPLPALKTVSEIPGYPTGPVLRPLFFKSVTFFKKSVSHRFGGFAGSSCSCSLPWLHCSPLRAPSSWRMA